MFLKVLHRFDRVASLAIAAALWLAVPQALWAQPKETRVYVDEDYDFRVSSPQGWHRFNPASLSVPGEVCRAWTPDGTSTVSIFVQKPDTAVHPRVILDGSAAAIKGIGGVVKEQELRTVAGMQAMWLVGEGDGTGAALTGKGTIRTAQHWVAIPRARDIVVLLLNAPASDFVTAEATFKAMLATLRIGGVQTPEQKAPEPPRKPAAAVNLDFEAPPGEHSLSQGWDQHGVTPPSGGEGYEIKADREVAHGGRASGRIRLVNEHTHTFGTLTQAIAADAFRGKRVRLSGWLRTRDVDSGFAGLWLRIDPALGFDNMSDRGVKGTTEWSRYEVVLDVPKEAENVVFGALLVGGGTAWVDDLELAAVGPATPEAKSR